MAIIFMEGFSWSSPTLAKLEEAILAYKQTLDVFSWGPPMNVKWGKSDWNPIHPFREGKAEGSATDTELLGGKGANLAEMCNLGLPVPPGFTIDTGVCHRFNRNPSLTLRYLMFRVTKAYAQLVEECGHAPLVSVRSGAPVSMPGMLDTVSNVGLTMASLPFWVSKLGRRSAYDCRFRLILEYARVVHGKDLIRGHGRSYWDIFRKCPDKLLVELETKFLGFFRKATGKEFPEDLMLQLRGAIGAVFGSWSNPRAVEYRRLNYIPETLGTAVTVQRMVFGNKGDHSATGVVFTRNPATGESNVLGEFLFNAQGEDVVSGTKTPIPIEDMPASGIGDCFVNLMEIAESLDFHYGDMQDIEFTIEENVLYILQTRTGKRTAEAAFRIASDQVKQDRWTKEEALERLSPSQYFTMQREQLDPSFKVKPDAEGIPASPGFACGVVVHSNESALESKTPCILVRRDTNPDDLPGMNAAVGILTGTGGATSHAAVVARSMDTPCVTGLLEVDEWLEAGALSEGVTVSIDGSSGKVWVGLQVPTISGAEDPCVKRAVAWGYEKIGVLRESPRIEDAEQCVPVAEWTRDPESMVQSFAAIKEMSIPHRSKIVLDLRAKHSKRRDEDTFLWKAFGDDMVKTNLEDLIQLIIKIKQAKLKGTTLVLDRDMEEFIPQLEKAGYRVGRSASTVSDLLLSGGPVCVDSDFIEKVMGGSPAYAKFLDVIDKAGQMPEMVPSGMSPEEVVANTFGG